MHEALLSVGVELFINTMSINRLNKSMVAITWLAPTIGIPALRYFQDNRQHRNELFLRDASTYALGAGIFFATNFIAKYFFKSMNLFKQEIHMDFAAFLLAIAANILYAGIGAVKLSQYYAYRHPWEVESPKSAQTRFILPNRFSGAISPFQMSRPAVSFFESPKSATVFSSQHETISLP